MIPHLQNELLRFEPCPFDLKFANSDNIDPVVTYTLHNRMVEHCMQIDVKRTRPVSLCQMLLETVRVTLVANIRQQAVFGNL